MDQEKLTHIRLKKGAEKSKKSTSKEKKGLNRVGMSIRENMTSSEDRRHNKHLVLDIYDLENSVLAQAFEVSDDTLVAVEEIDNLNTTEDQIKMEDVASNLSLSTPEERTSANKEAVKDEDYANQFHLHKIVCTYRPDKCKVATGSKLLPKHNIRHKTPHGPDLDFDDIVSSYIKSQIADPLASTMDMLIQESLNATICTCDSETSAETEFNSLEETSSEKTVYKSLDQESTEYKSLDEKSTDYKSLDEKSTDYKSFEEEL